MIYVKEEEDVKINKRIKVLSAFSLVALAGVSIPLATNGFGKTLESAYASLVTRNYNIIPYLVDKIDNSKTEDLVTIQYLDTQFKFAVKNVTADKTKGTISIVNNGYITNVTAMNGLSQIGVVPTVSGDYSSNCSILHGRPDANDYVDLAASNRVRGFASVVNATGSTNFSVVVKGSTPVELSEINVKYACLSYDTENNIDTEEFTFNKSTIFGDGTSVETAYLIENNADFDEFISNLQEGVTYRGKYVSLLNNVTANKAGFYELDGMVYGFDGVFLGNGNKITLDIEVQSGEQEYAGVFGYSDSGTFQNLVLDGELDAPNTKYVGSLIGYAGSNVTIDNVQSSATLTGYGYVGGIVGESYSAVSNCSYNGSLNNKISEYASYNQSGTGGIVGMCMGKITNCNVGTSANIIGHFNVGGIVEYLKTL